MGRGLVHSTALVESAKTLEPSKVKGYGKVPYYIIVYGTILPM